MEKTSKNESPTEEKPKKKQDPIGGKQKVFTKSDSICWNCKKAAGKPGEICSWAKDFTPIEGWKASPRGIYRVPNLLTGEETKTVGYYVEECPLFDQNHMFMSYAEAVKVISETLGIDNQVFYRESARSIKRYEKKIDKEVPLWVKYRAEYGDN